MPYTGDQALAWVKNIIKPADTTKFRHYAVLDLVGFMGIISHFENDEWYKSYALLLYYNTLGKDKQNAMGMKYASPLKFSYTDGAETVKANRDKDTKPTVDKNKDLLAHKNVELHGCGQCAYFAEQAGQKLGIPQLKGKPVPPKVEQVALSNHNLVRVNGDAVPAHHVIVDLWQVALGYPVDDAIAKLGDWALKGQYDREKGFKRVTKTYDPVANSWA